MSKIPRLPDGLKCALPAAVVVFLVVVFVQLAENVAQCSGATGLVECAFKDPRGMDHDVGQV